MPERRFSKLSIAIMTVALIGAITMIGAWASLDFPTKPQTNNSLQVRLFWFGVGVTLGATISLLVALRNGNHDDE